MNASTVTQFTLKGGMPPEWNDLWDLQKEVKRKYSTLENNPVKLAERAPSNHQKTQNHNSSTPHRSGSSNEQGSRQPVQPIFLRRNPRRGQSSSLYQL